MRNLRTKISSGVLWSSISVLSERVLGIITVAFLARLLEPKDFAVVAIATMAISFITYFTDVGFEAALIQDKNEIDKAASTAFYLVVTLCLVAYVTLYCVAPCIADFYENSQVNSIIRIIALNLVIQSISRVHNILLSKQLDFQKKSICEIIPNIIYALVSIPMAFWGKGVMSIAYGMVAKSFARTTLLYIVSTWRPKLVFDNKIAKSIINYGSNVMSNNLLTFLSENIDNAMIGKLLGLTPLSFYKMSYNAANMTSQVSFQILGRVAIPVIAQLQDDTCAMVRVFIKIVKYALFVVTPVFFGLYFFADQFIALLYGPKWSQSILLFKTLLVFGYFSMIRMFSSTLFLASGYPKYLPRLTLLRVIMIITIVYSVKDYGINVICIGIVFTEAILTLIQLVLQKRIYDIGIVMFLKIMLNPAILSLLMFVSLHVAKIICSSITANTIIAMMLEIIFGISLYLITTLCVSKDIRNEFANLLKWRSNVTS